MSVHGWKQLAEWSIEHSCLSEDDIKQAKAIFSQDWEQWCRWVVAEYKDFADRLEEVV
jgi:adenosine deaminase CECR1